MSSERNYSVGSNETRACVEICAKALRDLALAARPMPLQEAVRYLEHERIKRNRDGTEPERRAGLELDHQRAVVQTARNLLVLARALWPDV